MIVEIENYYREGDGDDWLPAVTRAQQQWESMTSDGNVSQYRGFSLLFGPREYRFSGSIELIRGMGLMGSGGSAPVCGTILTVPPGAHGIISHFDATSSPPGRGAWSIVERVYVRATGIGAAVAHGVLMHSSVIVRDVYIHGFSGNGIQISADVNRTPPTDGNHWQIQNCFVSACLDGLHVEGGDSSAGCAIALDCRDNRGWGINDASFHGNTYIACRTYNDALGAYRCARGTRSLFLNCYTEGGQNSEINQPGIVLGGYMNVEGDGIWFHPEQSGTFMRGVRGVGRNQAGNAFVAAYLGSATLSDPYGVALELHHLDRSDPDPNPYRLHYGQINHGWWEFIYNNINGSPLRLSTGEATEGYGHLWLEDGYFLGQVAHRVRVQSGPITLPYPATGTKGDRILNSDPDPGHPEKGYAGLICTQSDSPGSPALWKKFGLIEP